MDTVFTLLLTTVFVFIIEKALVQIYSRLIGNKKRRK